MAKNIDYVYDVYEATRREFQTPSYTIIITGPKHRPSGALDAARAEMNKQHGKANWFVCELRDAHRKRYIAKPDWEVFSLAQFLPYTRGQ